MKNQDKPVVYIRVRKIFYAYLKYAYGDFPIDVPSVGCRLHDVMSCGLVPNYSMKRICYSSFSQKAYNTAFGDESRTIFDDIPSNACLPSEYDKQKLVPFVMPAWVIIGGRRCATDQWFQISDKCYQEFSRCIESEFWNSFIVHDQKFNQFCYRTGKRYSQEGSVESYMRQIGMDFGEQDTLTRYWRLKKADNLRTLDRFNKKEATANLGIDTDL